MFRINDVQDGTDANYGARFTPTTNLDFGMWQGKLYTAYWRASRYDPKPFDWDPPGVGSDICLLKKIP